MKSLYLLIFVVLGAIILEAIVYLVLRIFANKHESSVLNKPHGVRDVCIAIAGMLAGIVFTFVITCGFSDVVQ